MNAPEFLFRRIEVQADVRPPCVEDVPVDPLELALNESCAVTSKPLLALTLEVALHLLRAGCAASTRSPERSALSERDAAIARAWTWLA